MYTIRMLPFGVPVAAGISTNGNAAVVVLSVLGLLLMLLAVRSVRLRRAAAPGNQPGWRS